MDSYRVSSANEQVDELLRAEPPVEGASLVGWVGFSEWSKPSGERVLVLMGKPEANIVQLKAYVHSGLLHMVWRSFGEPSEPEAAD
jgi:hypothetical protein